MASFDETAEVAIRATRPFPGPGHRFPNADFTLTNERQVVDGETANAVKDALPHTFVTEEDVDFEVVGQKDGPEPAQDLIDAVGQSTAENLADAGYPTLEDAREASDEELTGVKLVGQSTVDNKIREDSGEGS